jgi:hypothetical protein
MPFTIDQPPDDDRAGEELPATPYGPHPRGVDAAAGGADSSPLDTEPTGVPRIEEAAERKELRDKPTQRGGPSERSPNTQMEE